MGCILSKEEEVAINKSNAIDRDLRSDAMHMKKQFKLLLLGAGESGKSTVAKQLKILHQEGFTAEELDSYKPVIFQNTCQSMVAIVEAMKALQIEYAEEANEAIAEKFRGLSEADILMIDLNHEMGSSLAELWKDDGVQACFRRQREYQLNDSAAYYMEALERLCAPGYRPTVQDVLRSRTKTTGIIESKFEYREHEFILIDVGGQRSERRKWIHCFEQVFGVIFCVNIAGYDQKLREENTDVNRLQESLKLFDQVRSNGFFRDSCMILFLNKTDLFREKIQHTPLKVCFPEYAGADTYEEAGRYIEGKFCESKDDRAAVKTNSIYPHYTCATNTGNIEAVFNTITDVLIKKVLESVFM